MFTNNNNFDLPKIKIFRPNWMEFRNFNAYIASIETKCAHHAGIAKIIPPAEYVPRKAGYNMNTMDITIPTPIEQSVYGSNGVYQQFNISKRPLTIRQYQQLAESQRYRTPTFHDYDDLERKYWRNIQYISAIYGADVHATLIDPDVKHWNINALGSILDYVTKDYKVSIAGVNTAYLYFGMWKTSFAWHIEDMDLYSINYIHFGAPKTWYAIPPLYARKFEALTERLLPQMHQNCSAYLRHKMTLISPDVLKRNGIPFNKIVQEPGEIIITFPYGYHAGFNHGFNCAESTNFATQRWIEYGKSAELCECSTESVKISMDSFVKRFQPKRYDLWKSGKDHCEHPLNADHRPSKNRILMRRCSIVLKRCSVDLDDEPTVKRKIPLRRCSVVLRRCLSDSDDGLLTKRPKHNEVSAEGNPTVRLSDISKTKKAALTWSNSSPAKLSEIKLKKSKPVVELVDIMKKYESTSSVANINRRKSVALKDITNNLQKK